MTAAANPALAGGAMPASPRKLSPVEYWLVTLAVMCASLIQFLDHTIANVAIPHMQASLNASPDSVTWILTSFIVASAVAIPAAGWVASRFGTRNPFLFSLAGFLVSSMLCGIAVNLEEMVLFRILQGICAAFIAPLAQAILLDITEPSKHTRALSIWGMTSMLGPIIGPTLGGYLTDNFSWRWVFYINAPIGIPALLILIRLLPDSGRMARRFDIYGYAYLAIAIAALQLMLDRGQVNDWFESGETIVELVVALCAFWLFLIHTRFTRAPLFPIAVIRNPRVAISAVFGLIMAWIMMGVAAVVPTLFQTLYGYSVAQTGEVMAPRGIGIFLIMMIMPRLMALLPLRAILVTGFALGSLSIWQMTRWTLVMPAWELGLSAFIQGVGMGMLMVPINYIAFSAVAPEHRTDVSSYLSLVRNLAGSTGISLLVVFISRSAQIVHADMVPLLDAMRLGVAPMVLEQYGAASAMAAIVNAEVTRQATMVAYINAFELLFLFSLVAIPVALLVKGKAQAE